MVFAETKLVTADNSWAHSLTFVRPARIISAHLLPIHSILDATSQFAQATRLLTEIVDAEPAHKEPKPTSPREIATEFKLNKHAKSGPVGTHSLEFADQTNATKANTWLEMELTKESVLNAHSVNNHPKTTGAVFVNNALVTKLKTNLANVTNVNQEPNHHWTDRTVSQLHVDSTPDSNWTEDVSQMYVMSTQSTSNMITLLVVVSMPVSTLMTAPLSALIQVIDHNKVTARDAHQDKDLLSQTFF